MALSAATSARKPVPRFSVPGMLLTLVAGVASGALAGLVAYLISWIIPFGIPGLLPAFAGAVVGLVTAAVGQSRGRCHSRFLAIAVAAIAAMVGWSSRHAVDYARFRWDAYHSIAAEVRGVGSASINGVIDEWLRDETGQSGFAGFMLLKAQSQEVQLYQGSGSAVVGTLRLTGPLLILYWMAELAVAGGVAALLGSKYAAEPYCDRCGAWRSNKVIVPGSVEHLSEAIEALNRGDMEAAVDGLGEYEGGDVARLQVYFCPACCDNVTSLVVAGDTRRRVVWSQKLDPSSARELLALAR